MKSHTPRKLLVTTAAFLALAAAAEVGMYNWRITLALEVEELRERVQDLRREWEDLLTQRALLCSPSRLREVGVALGLGPVPLDRVRIVCLPGPAAPLHRGPGVEEECLAAAD